MKVEAKTVFDDLKEGTRRERGDQFTVTHERYEQIKNWVKVIDEPKGKPEPEATKEDKTAANRKTK